MPRKKTAPAPKKAKKTTTAAAPPVVQGDDEEALTLASVPTPAAAPTEVDVTPSLLATNLNDTFSAYVLGRHTVNTVHARLPEVLSSDNLIARVKSMLVSAADLAVYHGYDKYSRGLQGDCYIGEVVWSQSDKHPVGSFVACQQPLGIAPYVVVPLAQAQAIPTLHSKFLSAPFAFCAMAVFEALAIYRTLTQKVHTESALAVGTTAHASLIAQLHKGAQQFTGHKFSLLNGQQFDIVYDCRINVDVVNAARLVKPGGVYVQVVPGTHGVAGTGTHTHGDNEQITCVYPTYDTARFAEYNEAYGQSPETAQLLEAYAVPATPATLASALGARNALVRLSF